MRKRVTISLVIFSLLAGMFTFGAGASGPEYVFFAETSGGAMAYDQYDIDNPIVVWVNGGRVTYGNGAIVNTKTTQVNLFERESLDSGYYNISRARGVVWGANLTPTPPQLDNGRFRDTSARTFAKVSRGAVSAVREVSSDTVTPYIHAYRTAKVDKTTISTPLGSFRVEARRAPTALNGYREFPIKDEKFNPANNKVTSMSLSIEEEDGLYIQPFAGNTRQPLAVHDSTRYSAVVTRGERFIAISKTSSGSPEGFLAESALSLTFDEIQAGIFIKGVESLSPTQNGTATVTVTCLDNGRRRAFNITVRRPPSNTNASQIEVSFGDGKTVEFNNSSGTAWTKEGNAADDGEIIDETTFEVNVGNSAGATLKITPAVDLTTTRVTYSAVRGASVTSNGVVTMNRPQAIVRATIIQGPDRTDYTINLNSTSHGLNGAVPKSVSMTGAGFSFELTDEEIQGLVTGSTTTLNKTVPLEAISTGTLSVTAIDGSQIRTSSGGSAPTGDEVVVTIAAVAAGQSGSVGPVTSTGTTVTSLITLNNPSLQVRITMRSQFMTTTINLTFTTEMVVDSRMSHAIFAGTRGNFTAFSPASQDPALKSDTVWPDKPAGYFTTIALNQATINANHHLARQIDMVLSNFHSTSAFTYKFELFQPVGNNSAQVSEDGIASVFPRADANVKQAYFYVDVTPKHSGALETETTNPAQSRRYRIRVTWP
ncbi:MAG: hypothetical protein FWH05_02580 [Oscillospiraceae bacterium]|nr:hypothetical protein [Oscillospiraceae bacterium]